MQQNRIIPLECARGIASIIVIFHHFLKAFHPSPKDFVWQGGFGLTPVYFLVNGAGAVTFFFVLSGFVLTVGLFKNPSPEVLATAVLKRLPRLMIPAGASIFLGFLVLKYTGGHYLSASVLSGSEWLGDFGNAMFPANFTPSALDALQQSLLVFLYPNNFYYNSNLWTMFSEFYGSLLVFGIVLLFGPGRLHGNRPMVLLHVGLIVMFAAVQPDFVPFVAGSFLAYRIAGSAAGFQVSARWTGVLLAGAVVGFATEWWLANTLASIFVIVSLLGNRALADRLSGRLGALVGKLSFPLYLVHVLVILSVSSFVFERLLSAGSSMIVASCATLLVTVLVSGLVSLPFALLDTVWVSWLNRMARSVVKSVAVTCRRHPSRASLGPE